MNRIRLLLLLPIFFVLFTCRDQASDSEPYICLAGATIIDGTGSAPIENGQLLLQKGRVIAVGKTGDIQIPGNAIMREVYGKTIVPGFINGHGHVGDVKGIDSGNYSKTNCIDNLEKYARYGITTVVSLGGDHEEAESLRAVNDTLNIGRARLFIAGEIITGDTPETALEVIDKNVRMGVDIMKIRVDDQLGTTEKMPEKVYRAVIKRSHELGYRIATHMYYLEDARKLVEAGSDMLAHSVRDQPVDSSFIQLLKNAEVCYCPTLTRELSTFVYGDTAAFFTDDFFQKEYDLTTIQPLLNPDRQAEIRNSRSARIYKEQLPTAMTNLKILCRAGIPIVFGTDTGVPTRFIGYFEHLEMEMMAEAGLTPMEIIVSATRNPAKYLGLKDLGTLTPGNRADFILLDADPLQDIKNMRKISGVFIGGKEISR